MPVRSLCCPTSPTDRQHTLTARPSGRAVFLFSLWQRGRGEGGDVFGAKTPPPCTPSRNVGAFRSRTPSRIAIGGPIWGRQSRRFLETGSLHPPLAALRLFPPHPLTTQRGGAAVPPLWISLPGNRTAAAEREAGPFDDHPESKPVLPNAGKQFSVPLGDSAPGTCLQVCTAPATTTPVLRSI